MYYLQVTLLMLILPAASVLAEWLAAGTAFLPLIGKWFVFWAGDIRLFIAGLRQYFNPAFTAEAIFETKDEGARL